MASQELETALVRRYEAMPSVFDRTVQFRSTQPVVNPASMCVTSIRCTSRVPWKLTPSMFWSITKPVMNGETVVPVTVTDYAGRWQPVVFLIKACLDRPEEVLREVRDGLENVHILGETERLVMVPSSSSRSPTSSVQVAVSGNDGCTSLAYVGESALRFARNGVMYGQDDNNVQIVFSVIPTVVEHNVILNVTRGSSTPLITFAQVVLPSSSQAAVLAALSPYMPGADADYLRVHILTKRLCGQHWVCVNVEMIGTLDGVVMNKRTYLPNGVLEEEFARQAEFASMHACVAWASDQYWTVNQNGINVISTPSIITATTVGSPLFDLRIRVFLDPECVHPMRPRFVRALTGSHPCWDLCGDDALQRAVGVYHESVGRTMVRETDAWLIKGVEDASLGLGSMDGPEDLAPEFQLTDEQKKTLKFMTDTEDSGPLSRKAWFEHAGLPGVFSPFLRNNFETEEYGCYVNDAAPVFASGLRGGIVANEAGTGKTIVSVALMLARPTSPTLVLCPPTIVTQWASEVARAAPSLSVSAVRTGKLVNMDASVVICGYPQMLSSRLGVLNGRQWHRIIVDEAHLVASADMVANINTTNLWLLTGTPMRTSNPMELNKLVGMFVGGDRPMIPNPHNNRRVMNVMNTAQTGHTLPFLSQVMCRFTAPCHVESDEAIRVEMPPTSRTVYDELEEESREDFREVGSYEARIMSRPVMRLARFCAGARLPPRIRRVVPSEDASRTEGAATVVYNEAQHGVGFNDPEVDACAICMEPMMYSRAAMTPCRHWFCMVCLTTAVARNNRCPTCRKPVTVPIRAQPLVSTELPGEASDQPTAGQQDEAREAASHAVFLAKVAALVRYANGEARDEKVVVFTLHTLLAHRYAAALREAGVSAIHYTRNIAEPVRNGEKSRFVTDPTVRVIVVDLKNAEGIDGLQCARHVVFCEPFNAQDTSKRIQAISRCDRMGQERPVIVRTLYMEGTVEDRMVNYVAPPNVGRRRDTNTTLVRRQLRVYIGL